MPARTAARASATMRVVAYLVECAHHVAQPDRAAVSGSRRAADRLSRLLSERLRHRILESMCTHPNVGAVLLVSLGCEEFRRSALREAIRGVGPPGRAAGHPGRRRHPRDDRGRAGAGWRRARRSCDAAATVPLALADLVIGTKCGGSDGLSGITINPAVGHAFDLLGDAGATLMFEETCELIGCEHHMAQRAVTPRARRGDRGRGREGRQPTTATSATAASAAATSSTGSRTHRGEVARRLCQERHAADRRPAQARRPAAARPAST